MILVTEELLLSEEELLPLAQKLSEKMKENKILLLKGNLGSGKTTLVKEICKAFGVEHGVSSPSFGIVNEYENKSAEKIYHIDLYRLDSPEEFWNIGGAEHLADEVPIIIEWPELIEPFIDKTDGRVIEVLIESSGTFDNRLYRLKI